MADKLITIILPLWDREVYTSTWIKENVFDEFNYIIADGSKSEKNKKIFESLGSRSNIKYIQFPFDRDIKTYIKKMTEVSSKVKTPYVMTCDNDDFLNHKVIKKYIDVLEKNPEYGFANGVIKNIRAVKKNSVNHGTYYRLCFGRLDTLNLHNKKGEAAIRNLFRPYKHLWYAIYRTNIYKRIWQEIKSSGIKNVFLVEYFHAQLSFCFARLYADNSVHYIRLSNPISNAATLHTYKNEANTSGIYFDAVYRSQVLKMAKIISRLTSLDIRTIYSEYIYFYSHPLRGARLRDLIKNMFLGRFLNAISPPLKIKYIKKYLHG